MKWEVYFDTYCSSLGYPRGQGYLTSHVRLGLAWQADKAAATSQVGSIAISQKYMHPTTIITMNLFLHFTTIHKQ